MGTKTNATIPAASLTSYADGARWSEGCNEYMTAESHEAITLGDVLQVTADVGGARLKDVGTLAAPGALVCVACETTDASGNYIIVQTRGFAEASVEGTTDVAAGDFLKVTNGVEYFVKDGASLTVNSSAVAIDAEPDAGPTVVSVYLLGTPAVIA